MKNKINFSDFQKAAILGANKGPSPEAIRQQKQAQYRGLVLSTASQVLSGLMTHQSPESVRKFIEDDDVRNDIVQVSVVMGQVLVNICSDLKMPERPEKESDG